MKKAPANRSATNDLPDFLDVASAPVEAAAVATDEAHHAAEPSTDRPPPPLAGERTVDLAAEQTDVGDTHERAFNDAEPPAAVRTTRATRPRARPGSPSSTRGGGAGIVLGALGLIAALAAMLMPTFADALTPSGVTGPILLLLGTVLFATGLTRRYLNAMVRQFEDGEARREAAHLAVHERLDVLVTAHESHDKVPVASEEVQHVLLSLERQGDKINNLTKAIKMYGKPLLDISNQGTELLGSVAQVRALIEGGTDATRKAIGRVEVAVASVTQRNDDGEVKKCLMRLEEATQKSQEQVQNLRSGDSAREFGNQMQARLDKTTAQLTDALAKLRDGSLVGLETTVRDIQREVAGLATTLAQVQAAVRGGIRTGATAPTANAPATTGGPVAAGPAPAATPAASDAPAEGYQTGTRSTGGKNVLGAIAKLKQMKG